MQSYPISGDEFSKQKKMFFKIFALVCFKILQDFSNNLH